MEKEFLKEQQYLNAKKRVKEIKGFYSHFLIYVLINIFISGIIIFGLTYNDNSSLLETLTNFGVYSTWLFWGIGIFFHWLSVFGFKNLLGSSWEEKKIRELMKKEDERSVRRVHPLVNFIETRLVTVMKSLYRSCWTELTCQGILLP